MKQFRMALDLSKLVIRPLRSTLISPVKPVLVFYGDDAVFISQDGNQVGKIETYL